MRADTFSRRLEIALRRSKSSQARLAREAEIDQSSISRYLRGQCEPNLRQFRAIAAALNVAPSFLLGDDLEPVVLANAEERGHYYVFREGVLLGKWIGDELSVFPGAEVVDDETGKSLLSRHHGRSDGTGPRRAKRRNGHKGD